MKSIRCNLPQFDVIQIDTLADLHIGDGNCDYKSVQERIAYIRNTPNVYCILNGDLMDTAISSSIGDTYGANLQPMEQLKHCISIFEPIKEKILCITPGNHENRVYKSDGLDMTEIMCAQLGIPQRYSPTTALLFVRFGKGNSRTKGRPLLYTVYVTHGSGGGRREGGKINRLSDLSAIVDADIYVHSHTHLPVVFKNAFYRVSESNSSVSLAEKMFINTGASLDYGGYGDRQGYKPASKKTPMIFLNGKKKEFWAKL